MAIHPTAIVDRGAELGRDVEIGPYSVVGPQVRLGDRVKVGAHVVLEGRTTVGEEGEILPFSILGSAPGHLKDRGEGTELVIGKRVTIREHVSLHRGTKLGTGRTVIGDDCAFLANTHVGHDCVVGNGVLLVTGAALGGHVVMEDFSTCGGEVGVHQHVRVGTMAMVGAGSIANMDIPPYCLSEGGRARLVGLNLVGLKRRGLALESIRALKESYRIVFRSGAKREEALEQVKSRFAAVPEALRFATFIAATKRGVARHGRDSE